jgi:hypothetical protein
MHTGSYSMQLQTAAALPGASYVHVFLLACNGTGTSWLGWRVQLAVLMGAKGNGAATLLLHPAVALDGTRSSTLMRLTSLYVLMQLDQCG